MTFGPCQETSNTAITLNPESNFTRREKTLISLTSPELLIQTWVSCCGSVRETLVSRILEDEVQTLAEDAVNSVKAFFDIAVQAMKDKADQVGRSTKNMTNVQIVRIDDALSWLLRLEPASTSTFTDGATTRRDNIVT